MDYKKINEIAGWAIFVIATLVYALTVEETASFWDCGEFIAVSYKLEVPHPPGAPLFLLIGKMFSFLAMGDVTLVAYWINMASVISSGFTILFLFWTITLLGRKVFNLKSGEETQDQTLLVMGAGVIGALAYTFSDSFWFSAVEAEVYAMSSFFTAFVFWAILKWELIEDESKANRWLILIAYMIGLSIGVHLLNLVTIPALGLIYYFKKHQVSRNGIIVTMIISVLIVLTVQIGVIPGLPSMAGAFEIFFVNSVGLPFGSGIVIFLLILFGSLIYGIYYSIKKEKSLLNTALLCFAFILIGYSSYSLVVIRSNYNPPIDENSPDDLLRVVSYLKREQYGERPLLYGPYFTAELENQENGDPVYAKGEDEYEIVDYKIKNSFDKDHMTILPRAWSRMGNHPAQYRSKLDLKSGQKPSFVDNIGFMLGHQMGHMYWRYFMWNFAGRQSDIEGASWLAPWDAFEEVPDILSINKGRNNFFMLPLLLGLLGAFFHYRRHTKDFAVVGMLFLLTGLAIVFYLNSPPVEPRERDYIYAGSFYAFAIWIGFGVFGVAELLKNLLKNNKSAAIGAIVVSLAIPGIMAAEGWDDHDRSDRYFSVDSAKNFLASLAPNAIIFTGGDNDTFPLWYVQEVEGFRTDVRVIVQSYFNTDWYIDQMTEQAYESDPLPFSMQKEHYRTGTNDYLPFVENPNIKGALPLNQYIDLLKKNHPALQVQTQLGGTMSTLPSKIMYMEIDTNAVEALDIVPEQYAPFIAPQMVWKLKDNQRGLEKKDLMTLDLIANNNWKRPIYFNHTSRAGLNVDLDNYMVQEGNAYRLLPIENPQPGIDMIDTDAMYDNIMTKYSFRELNNPDVYYSEDYRNFVLNHRSSFETLAAALIQEGKNEKAKEVLFKSFELMPDEAVPYDIIAVQMIGHLLQLDEVEKATEIADILATRADQMLTYYKQDGATGRYDPNRDVFTLSSLARAFYAKKLQEQGQKYENLLTKYAGQS